MNSSHARCAGQRAVAAFERAHELFEGDIRWILVACIREALFLPPHYAIELRRALVQKRCGAVNGRGHGDRCRGFFAITRVYSFGCDVHLRFQRVPSLVSSRMMPPSRSCFRISSERGKLRAFFACCRWSIKSCTWASESPPFCF